MKKTIILLETLDFVKPPVPFISESCIEIKIKLNFYFHTSLWCLKRFYEGLLKALIKPFEAPQRSVKKINLIFSIRPGLEREGLIPLKIVYMVGKNLCYVIH